MGSIDDLPTRPRSHDVAEEAVAVFSKSVDPALFVVQG
jgi:hypothetical protein